MSNASVFELVWEVEWILPLIVPTILTVQSLRARSILMKDLLAPHPVLNEVERRVGLDSIEFLLTVVAACSVAPLIFLVVGLLWMTQPAPPSTNDSITTTQAITLVGVFGAGVAKTLILFWAWSKREGSRRWLRERLSQKSKWEEPPPLPPPWSY